MGGKKYLLLTLDKKGRMHIPKELRKETGIEEQMIVEKEKNALVVKPIRKIKNPLEFLCSISVKTKKSPVEMKREAEEMFVD